MNYESQNPFATNKMFVHGKNERFAIVCMTIASIITPCVIAFMYFRHKAKELLLKSNNAFSLQ
jgi:hypothetical protein